MRPTTTVKDTMADRDDITIEREERAGAVVLRPIGDIDLSRAPSVRQQLGSAISAAESTVVIDLAEVPYMDSSGVATFVEAMQIARRQSRPLVLCAMQARVKSVFEIARLDTVFRITDTVDQALA